MGQGRRPGDVSGERAIHTNVSSVLPVVAWRLSGASSWCVQVVYLRVPPTLAEDKASALATSRTIVTVQRPKLLCPIPMSAQGVLTLHSTIVLSSSAWPELSRIRFALLFIVGHVSSDSTAYHLLFTSTRCFACYRCASSSQAASRLSTHLHFPKPRQFVNLTRAFRSVSVQAPHNSLLSPDCASQLPCCVAACRAYLCPSFAFSFVHHVTAKDLQIRFVLLVVLRFLCVCLP